jgi:hypothetical protein
MVRTCSTHAGIVNSHIFNWGILKERGHFGDLSINWWIIRGCEFVKKFNV